jgi:peptidoglycan/LPS O-acetylase OafA/YrhL
VNAAVALQAPAGHRLGPVDALRAFASVLIVWHHLAFYGPMSDVVRPLAPGLIDWLYDYGRMAVQVFLVVSGYLLAANLAQQTAPRAWLPQVGRRYLRLLVPYAAALTVAILVAEAVRAWSAHPAVTGEPTWPQMLAHLLMLQDLVGEESLSAGVWYVAIDLQLFALATAICACGQRLHPRAAVCAVAALTLASLLVFNRQSELDSTAFYFFGAYGMGMLAAWGVRSTHPRMALAGIAMLGLLALLVDPRARIAVAWLTALGLGLLQLRGWMDWQPPAWIAWLARVSYPVFLVHFSVLLAVGALWRLWWPTQPLANGLGMLLVFVVSLWGGAALQRLEQGSARLRTALGWQLAVLVAGLLAISW